MRSLVFSLCFFLPFCVFSRNLPRLDYSAVTFIPLLASVDSLKYISDKFNIKEIKWDTTKSDAKDSSVAYILNGLQWKRWEVRAIIYNCKEGKVSQFTIILNKCPSFKELLKEFKGKHTSFEDAGFSAHKFEFQNCILISGVADDGSVIYF